MEAKKKKQKDNNNYDYEGARDENTPDSSRTGLAAAKAAWQNEIAS